MPIYGYTCDNCEHTFDALQKMSDPKLVECPECGKATLRKLLSAPKFRLKGSGWYETDFKTGDKRNVVAESETAAAKTGDTDKPAKQEETKTKEVAKTDTTKTPEKSKVKSA